MSEPQQAEIVKNIDSITTANRFYTRPPYSSVLAIRNRLNLDLQYYRMRYELRSRNKLFVSENAQNNIIEHDRIVRSLDGDGEYAYQSFLSSINNRYAEIEKYAKKEDYQTSRKECLP